MYESHLITVKDAAAMLGVRIKQVYRLIEERQLPHYNYGKPGKRPLIRLSKTSVEDYKSKAFVPLAAPVKARH